MPSNVVDEMVILLGLDENPKAKATLARFQGQLAVVANQALDLAGKVYNAFEKIAHSVLGVGDASLQLMQLSERTGVSTDEIQKFQNAMERTGTVTEAVTGEVTAMLDGFTKQGLPAKQMLEQIAQILSNMPAEQAQLIGASQWGLSSAQIRMLRVGNDEIARLGKMGPSQTLEKLREQRKLQQDINDQLWELRFDWQQIKAEVLPAILDILKPMALWISENRKLIAQRVREIAKGIAEAFKEVWQTVKPIVEWFVKLTKSTGDWSQSVQAAMGFVFNFILALAALRVAMGLIKIGTFLGGLEAGVVGAAASAASGTLGAALVALGEAMGVVILAATAYWIGTKIGDVIAETLNLKDYGRQMFENLDKWGITKHPRDKAREWVEEYNRKHPITEADKWRPPQSQTTSQPAALGTNRAAMPPVIVPVMPTIVPITKQPASQQAFADNRSITQNFTINGTGDPRQTAEMVVQRMNREMNMPGAYSPLAQ